MNVKVLREDSARVTNRYAMSGDQQTAEEAKRVIKAARYGQIMGVFDHGSVVGLVAVNPATGDILEASSLPGVDISAPIGRIIDHYEAAARQAENNPSDYRPRRRPQRPVAPDTSSHMASVGDDVPLPSDSGQYDIRRPESDSLRPEYDPVLPEQPPAVPEPAPEPAWGAAAREDSEFLRGWGSPEGSGSITMPPQSQPPMQPAPMQQPATMQPVPGQIQRIESSSSIQSPIVPSKKKAPVAGIVAGAILLLLFAAGVTLYLTGAWQGMLAAIGIQAPKGDGEDTRPKRTDDAHISIPDGYGSGQVAQLLYDANVIDSQEEFHKEITKQGAESSIKSGSYVFKPGVALSEVVSILVSGPNDTSARLTVPEGLSVARVGELVESQFGIPASEFVGAAKASAYVGNYPFLAEVREDSLEGFMWAGTYDFGGVTPTPDAIIRKLLDRFSAEVNVDEIKACANDLNAAYRLNLTWYDVLDVASVIEREATNEQDRPLIASVFYNRMRENQPLQSDATMAFVVGHEPTPEDLRMESAYNTYLNRGVPPTPIATPSPASLEAAKHPAQTNYYFFYIVERPGWSQHAFSETYDQHQAAIAEDAAAKAQPA